MRHSLVQPHVVSYIYQRPIGGYVGHVQHVGLGVKGRRVVFQDLFIHFLAGSVGVTACWRDGDTKKNVELHRGGRKITPVRLATGSLEPSDGTKKTSYVG